MWPWPKRLLRVGWMVGWAWNEVKALLFLGLWGLPSFFVELKRFAAIHKGFWMCTLL